MAPVAFVLFVTLYASVTTANQSRPLTLIQRCMESKTTLADTMRYSTRFARVRGGNAFVSRLSSATRYVGVAIYP